VGQAAPTSLLRVLVASAAIVVVIAGLRAAAPILIPVFVAALLAILTAPMVLWLEARRVPGGIAVLVAMLVLVVALVVLGAILTTTMVGFEEALPGYQAALTTLVEDVVELSRSLPIDLAAGVVAEGVSAGTVIEMLGAAGTAVLAAFSNTALVLLTVVFMLLELAGLPRKLRLAMDDPKADLGSWSGAIREVQRYLVIKTLISLATGAFISAWLWLLGVDFPLLWGLVAFVLNYIPNVGSIVAAVPGVLLALIQPGLGLGPAAAALAGYLVVNMVIGNLVEPWWMGRRLGLSPLVVFLSLVFWGFVWGPVGMIISVPLTMIARIVLEHWDESHWLVVLLGPAPAGATVRPGAEAVPVPDEPPER
jgi:AI-2 transport protein TqsA